MGVPTPRTEAKLLSDIQRRLELLEGRNRSSLPAGVVVLFRGTVAPAGYVVAAGTPAPPSGFIYISRA